MRSAIVFFLSVYTILLTSCGDDPVLTTSYLMGSIVGKIDMRDSYGTVLDDLNGATIELVGAKKYSVTTGPDGSFQFDKVDQGIYDVVVRVFHQPPINLKQIQFVGNGTLDLGTLNLLEYDWQKNKLTIIVSLFDENGNLVNDSDGVKITVNDNAGYLQSYSNTRFAYVEKKHDFSTHVKAEKEGFEYDEFGQYGFGTNTHIVYLKLFRVSKNNSLSHKLPEFIYTPIIINDSSGHGFPSRKDSLATIRIDGEFSLDPTYSSDIRAFIVADTLDYQKINNNDLGNFVLERKHGNTFTLATEPQLKGSMRFYSPKYVSIKENVTYYIIIRYMLKSRIDTYMSWRFPNGYEYAISSKPISFTIPK